MQEARNHKHMAKETIMPTKKGQKPISFNAGGEHASTGTPAGKPIPAKKKEEAREGKLGAKAEKQEIFRENVLTGPKKGRKAKPRSTSDGYMRK